MKLLVLVTIFFIAGNMATREIPERPELAYNLVEYQLIITVSRTFPSQLRRNAIIDGDFKTGKQNWQMGSE